ncbi:MAG: DUF3536 domain-containing protein, partial [Spirochaetota bacterium]|nr:DUF3536 domain-containing protein [Spirochaetota bacterium]
APYHDWNERISDECYAPNAWSRVMDKNGKISDIINNYKYMSFNFGPTLLSWMENHHKEAYEKILEADRESVSLYGGHGNALAQVYNHLIMPLASRKDKVTQVIWGIEDFKRRFKRDPEGMWLSETAVDLETLEVLSEHNIRFTILSPYQAKRWRTMEYGEAQWVNSDNGNIDPSMGYLCRLPNGRDIVLFFYDAHISQAVAFESLLRDGAGFSKRLLDGFSSERMHHQLLHIATDGETYGHHFKFGEMALSFALKDLEENHGVELMNYAQYLDSHPPIHEVEIHEKSSWSCFHGVERWKSDCGCKINQNPDWNQQWREPLRNSLDHLKAELDNIYETESEMLLKDCWEARNRYINVLYGRSDDEIRLFFEENTMGEPSQGDKVKLLKLFEMQRQAMLMFTSCGWFFDDISGIETVQILRHACRAIQIAHEMGYELEGEFVKGLSEAKSNHAELGNGEMIYKKQVIPSKVSLKRAMAHYAMASLLPVSNGDSGNGLKSLYTYVIQEEDYEKASHDQGIMAVGKLKITSKVTQEEESAVFASLHLGGHDFQCKISSVTAQKDYGVMKKDILNTFKTGSIAQVIRNLDQYFLDDFYTLSDLFAEERRMILNHVAETVYETFEAGFNRLYHENRRLAQYMMDLDIPIHKSFQQAAEYILSLRLDEAIEDELKVVGKRDYSSAIKKIMSETKSWRIELDLLPVSQRISQSLRDKMARFQRDFLRNELVDIIRFIDLSREVRLPISLWHLQNDYIALSKNPSPGWD